MATPLTEEAGIGAYLEGRLRRALRLRRPVTTDDLEDATATMTPEQVGRFLRRVLQNERSNQCVRANAASPPAGTYHTGDVNVRGYEACARVLRRAGRNVPRMPPRAPSSKACGCLDADACRRDRRCAYVSGACVPHAHNARGFVGASPHPDQSVYAPTPRARSRVRSAARTRSPRNDPDARRDVGAGHSPRMRYVQRGNRLWRSPSRKVRAPLA
jgi:hypothetical protein